MLAYTPTASNQIISTFCCRGSGLWEKHDEVHRAQLEEWVED